MDSLGVQGGSIPGLAPGGMVPVIQLGNLGDNFAAHVFEARGVASTYNRATAAGRWVTWSLHARSGGGVVIENILTDAVALGPSPASVLGPNGYFFLGRGPLSPGTGMTAFTPGTFGGPAPKSEWTAGTGAGIPHLPDWPCRLPPGFIFEGIKLWIPPGEYLNLMFNSDKVLGADPEASATVIWREIPEIQGAAG